MTIYSENGAILFDIVVDDNSYHYSAIMGDNSLTLHFCTSEYIVIPVGSYCVFKEKYYYLYTPQNLKMEHSRYFEYTIVMDSPLSQAKYSILRNTIDRRIVFEMCAKPQEHLQLIIDNLNRREASGWQIGDYPDENEKLITYDCTNCLEALRVLAETFSTEFEFEQVDQSQKIIHLHKVEHSLETPLPLSYGKGNGFKSGVSRNNQGDKFPIGRLYVQGGDRNINLATYGSKNLLLPRYCSIGYDGKYFSDEAGYIEEKSSTYWTSPNGDFVTYDTETNTCLNEGCFDGSEFYPQRIGRVSSVIKDGDKYDFIDNSIPSSLNYTDYQLENGSNFAVIFQSGQLAGREFAVSRYIHSSRKFQIVTEIQDEVSMPSEDYPISVGDTYIVVNCTLPQALIGDNSTKSGAEWDMFRAAVKYLYENKNPQYSFVGELDGIWAKRNWETIKDRIVLGGIIAFSDARFQVDEVLLRIIGIKEFINSPYSPEIELSENTIEPYRIPIKPIESRPPFIGIDDDKFKRRRWISKTDLLARENEKNKQDLSEISEELDNTNTLVTNLDDSVSGIKVSVSELDENLGLTHTIAVTAKSTADEATVAAQEADEKAVAAQNAVTEARTELRNDIIGLQTSLSNINSDTILTPLEKRVLRTEWEKINGSGGEGGSYATTLDIVSEIGYGEEDEATIHTFGDLVLTYNGLKIVYNYNGVREFREVYQQLSDYILSLNLYENDNTPDFGRVRLSALITLYYDKQRTLINLAEKYYALSTSEKALNDFVQGEYADDLSLIQTQIDQKSETWMQSTDPSVNWTDKDLHLGDIWWNSSNSTINGVKSGESAIYTKNGNTYLWNVCPVPEELFDRIDGKASLYTSKPNGYLKNDIWIVENNSVIGGFGAGTFLVATCNNNAYNKNDWQELVKYTDDTLASKAENDAANAQSTANSANETANEAKQNITNKVWLSDIQTAQTAINEVLNTKVNNTDYNSAVADLNGKIANANTSIANAQSAIQTQLTTLENTKVGSEDYNNALATLSELIGSKVSSDDYSQQVNSFLEDLANLQAELNSAATSIQAVQVAISNINADNVLDRSEKRAIRNEWDKIVGSYAAALKLADEFKIDKTKVNESSLQYGEYTLSYNGDDLVFNESWQSWIDTLNTAYSALSDFVSSLELDSDSELLDFDRERYSTLLIAYYTAEHYIVLRIQGRYSSETDESINAIELKAQELAEQIADTQYLKNAFPNNLDVDGLVMGEMLAVKSENEIKGIFNGSTFGNDNTKGRLMFASGIEQGTAPLEERARTAKTRIYEDGTVITTKGVFDSAAITNAQINNAQIVAAEMQNCNAVGGAFTEIEVESASITNAEMRDCNAVGGTFTNIKVVGTSRSPFVFAEQASQWELEGEDPNELDTNDNIVIPSTYSLNPLPYTPDQSGRRITIVCYKWGNAEYGNGNTLTAPSGKFFYEHGIKKQSISLSREYVELLGYGDPNNFYGWIVTNRRNISTEYSYGRPFNVLAQGLVTVNSQGTPSISARVFDKSAMSVSRADGGAGNGHFRINFNSNWFKSASDYLVMLTPYGKTNGRQYDTLATLVSRDSSSFRVNTLDVDGGADGGFEFLITNMNDWKDYNEF